ncbi:MAG: helix-turn-helix transcriptional regulator [Planctomycetota bacterium]
MTVEIPSSEHIRAVRGSALKQARKAAGLSAERLAQFVNDRTVGSDLTRHAIYSYEQGKVLLSREVGHRIATALQLHPGQLLLGDPEYAPTPPGSSQSASDALETLRENATVSGGGVDVGLRVELVMGAQRLLPVAEVLVRLLQKNKLGRVEIAGYLDVFHLLLEDTLPLTRSNAFLEIQDFGDAPGNEHPFALAAAVSRLHGLADAMLKRLIAPDRESPVSLYEYCETQTQALGKLTQTIRGEIDACNKRLPGVSAELD